MLLSFLPTESWVALAILAASLIGLGGTGEKILSIRYLPDATTLMLWLAVSLIVYSIIFGILYPFDASVPGTHIAAIFGSGAVYGIAITTFYRILRNTEASVSFAIFNTSPLFVAIFALLLLDQSLALLQWGSIILAIVGIIILSSESSENPNNKTKIYAIVGLIFCAALSGMSQVLGGYALNEVTAENAFWAQRIGALLPILLNLRRDSIGKFISTVKQPRTMVFVLVVEAVILPLAHLSFLSSLKIGNSVALVSTLFATAPVWVFVFSSVLSIRIFKILNEHTNPKRLFIKSVAISITVLAIVGIILL
tara:strand:- start:6953 stop:7882 length:930 start_codon:yes stop_codon:yes gene_type:complete